MTPKEKILAEFSRITQQRDDLLEVATDMLCTLTKHNHYEEALADQLSSEGKPFHYAALTIKRVLDADYPQKKGDL